jgi:hypothetical protein
MKISQCMMNRIIHGLRIPTKEQRAQLARLLGVDDADLFAGLTPEAQQAFSAQGLVR